MRPSLVVSLLLLSLLLSKAQGIRLEKGYAAVQQQKQHQEEESTLLKRSDGGLVEEAVLCKGGQCTGKIKKRKLVATPIATTDTISKNEKKGAHSSVNGNSRTAKTHVEEEETKVNTRATFKHRELPREQYADLVDVAEMDYSPARRKPPIHN